MIFLSSVLLHRYAIINFSSKSFSHTSIHVKRFSQILRAHESEDCHAVRVTSIFYYFTGELARAARPDKNGRKGMIEQCCKREECVSRQ